MINTSVSYVSNGSMARLNNRSTYPDSANENRLILRYTMTF